MSKELKTASVLAFERKLDPSDALLASGNWENRHEAAGWTPVGLREKSVRGTISNRLKTAGQDPAKLDAAIQNPNLQTEFKLLLKDSPNFIGVAKGEDKLRTRVNEIIAEAKKAGDLDKLSTKWLGRPAGDLPQ